MRSLKRYSWLLSGLVGLIILAGCNSSDGANASEDPVLESPSAATRTVRVQTLRIEPSTFTDVVALTGVVDAPDDARLSAQTAGTVLEVLPLGSHVSQGEVVAHLDAGMINALVKQVRAQVETAHAQADLAEDTYNRQKPLFQDSIISALEFENVRSQYNQAKAGLSQAEAALAQALEQLKYTRITAPFDGTIEERFVEGGEQVLPGTAIARIVDTRKVKVTAGVPERYASDIHTGSAVDLGFSAYGVPNRSGAVSFVGRVINPQNRTFPIEIELDNADGSLKPEMTATVFVTRATYEASLVVPQTAVLRDENGTSLYAVSRTDGTPKATLRKVELGSSYGGRVMILSGLEIGDEVIVVGQTNVTEGDVLEIVEDEASADTN